MARLLFTTLGSLGDLYPMLPVADRLRRRGHDPVFVVPSNLAPVAVEEGFTCAPFGVPPQPDDIQDRSLPAVRARIQGRYPAMLAAAVDALRSASADAVVIVTHQLQVAAAIAARHTGLPWVTLTMQPGLIPSSYTVPQPHWLPALPTPAGRLLNRLTWRVHRFALRYLSGDLIDAQLASLGVTRDDEVFTPGGLSPFLVLVLSSPAYSPRPADWPGRVRLVGYTEWDEPRSWRGPAELDRFLGEGEPPVLVMTSSVVGERDAAGFFRSAATAIKATGRRGLVLAGQGFDAVGLEPGGELAPGIAVWPFAPLSRVVERCSVVIHHAGFGSTLTTIRHGRPCIGIPAAYDQWYNAGRIRALGVGRVLELKRCTAAALTTELDRVLADPGYARRARELGAVIGQEDGAGCAADQIESLIGKS